MMTDNKQSLLVVGVVGSLRAGSYTRQAVRIALQGAAEMGAETRLIDLREYDLPFCDGEHDQVDGFLDALRLKAEIASAQGVILGTPDYHGSFSGVLKNALDLMGFDEFGGKVMGLVGVSGGALGTVNALNDLRKVGRSLHAWVIPQQAAVPQASQHFDVNGELDDPDYAKRLQEVGREVARFAYLLTSRETRAFLEMWENAMPNPGGEGR
jgi:NAD(P)H-dependent FMN reductase